jgi:hypothetical protein
LKVRIGTDADEGGLISHPILFFCSYISRHADSDIFPSRFLYTPWFWDFLGSMKLARNDLATACHCAPVHATARHSAPLAAKKSARKNLTGFRARAFGRGQPSTTTRLKEEARPLRLLLSKAPPKSGCCVQGAPGDRFGVTHQSISPVCLSTQRRVSYDVAVFGSLRFPFEEASGADLFRMRGTIGKLPIFLTSLSGIFFAGAVRNLDSFLQGCLCGSPFDRGSFNFLPTKPCHQENEGSTFTKSMHSFSCISQGFTVPASETPAPRISSESEGACEVWLACIRAAHEQGEYHVMSSARILSDARRALPFGEWSKLLRLAPFPHCKKKADSLVRIGGQFGDLPDEYVRTHLPTALRTLFQLSLLDRASLTKFVIGHRIHKGLTEAEAADLVREFRGLPADEEEEATELDKWLFRGVRLLDRLEVQPSERERHVALKLLRIIADHGAEPLEGSCQEEFVHNEPFALTSVTNQTLVA